MVRPVPRNRGRTSIQVGANGLEAPTPHAAPTLSIDEFRLKILIMQFAGFIALFQRFVPGKYLPPHEDRVPPSYLKRVICELKKLIPKWRWMSSAQALPRSPAKLGGEFFYAITALRMSRLEIWRAGYTDPVEVLDDVYSLPWPIGVQALARRNRSKAQQTAVQTQ